MLKKFLIFFIRFSIYLMFACTFTLGLVGIFIRVELVFSKEELIVFNFNKSLFYLVLVVSFFLLLFLPRLLKKVSETQLFLIGTIIYLVGGILFIFTSPDIIRADVAEVFKAATQMNAGDYSSLENAGYLNAYPFQLGLVSYDRLLISLYNSPRVLYIVNLLLIIGTNFVLWRLLSGFSGVTEEIKKIVIVFSFLFLPQFFFILFGYGSIPGFFFFVLACYPAQRFLQSKNMVFLILVIISLSISCLLKNNYLIGAMTLFCIFILYALKNKSVLLLIATLFCLVVPMNASSLVSTYYTHVSGSQVSEGAPKLLWVTMGLQNSTESKREGGWYNEYNINTFRQANFDNEKSAEIAKKDLKIEVDRFKKNPVYMFNFFTRKILSTWLEPLYQSIWSGPLLTEEKPNYYNFALMFMQVVMTFIFLFSAYYYFLCLRKVTSPNIFSLFPGIYFLGGFMFHLVWETKSQYVYTYVFLLIIPASFGLIALFNRVEVARLKKTNL